jgi:hypothetical protein
LIKALQDLERSASQDAEVRERIANLPTEVQDASGLENIEGIFHFACKNLAACQEDVFALLVPSC